MEKPPMSNFDRSSINVPVPDLAQIAAMKAMQDADPWFGVVIDVNRIPPSCLYDIFVSEAVGASNKATQLVNAVASGQLPRMPNGVALSSTNAALLIQVLMGEAQLKSNLAVAAATQAAAIANHPDLPRWNGPDGDRNNGYGGIYLKMVQDEKATKPAPTLILAEDDSNG